MLCSTPAASPAPRHPAASRPRRSARILAVACGAALGLAATVTPATAATITQEGSTLVYRTAGGERHSLSINDSYPAGRLRFEDSIATITAVPPSCVQIELGMADCEIPSGVRVEFGDDDDTFGFGDGYSLSVAVEVFGGAGDDTLRGDFDRPGDEVFHGGPGQDRIDGWGGNDQIHGGEGNDFLDGGAGADVVLGDDGDDDLKGDGTAAAGADVIDGGEGNDLLKDYVHTAVDIWPAANVSLDGVANDGRPGEGDNVIAVERIVAHVSGVFTLSEGNDDIQVWANMDSGTSTVQARGGDDRVVGHDASEQIDGGAGDDYLEGGKGHDTIVGGPGKDVIFGDETTSTCNPGFPESCVRYGNDVIDARDGEHDQIDCGPGLDRVVADAHDVAAANCEVVELGAVGGGDRPGGDGGSGANGTDKGSGGGKRAAAKRFTLVGRQTPSAVARKGLRVKLIGGKPGRATFTVSYRGRKAGSARVKVSRSGRATFRIKLSRTSARRIAASKRVRLTVRGAGARTTLTIKR